MRRITLYGRHHAVAQNEAASAGRLDSTLVVVGFALGFIGLTIDAVSTNSAGGRVPS